MKLDHLLSRGFTLTAAQNHGEGNTVDAVVSCDALPNVRVQYRNVAEGNTSLKIRMLVDDGLPEEAEGRMLDLRLYSPRSLWAFFELVALIREMVQDEVDGNELTQPTPLPA